MARKEKNTVDYFPHYAIQGKTMFTLEHNYGNDGYCVIFKTMEELCLAEYHYIDLNDPATLAYISAKCRVSENLYEEIISLLVKLGTFDKDLWENFQVICSENFLENIKDAYRNRKAKFFSINEIKNNLRKKSTSSTQSDVINTDKIQQIEETDVKNQQIILNKTKVNKIKENDINKSSCSKKSKNDDDFKKFLSFLKSLNGYEFSEKADTDLFLKIKRDNPNKDIFSAIESWCIANAGENPIENARTRLLSWVKNYQPPDKKLKNITKSPETTKKELLSTFSGERKSPMDDKETALKWLKSLTSSTISLRGMPQRVKEVCQKWDFNEQEFLKEISEKKLNNKEYLGV